MRRILGSAAVVSVLCCAVVASFAAMAPATGAAAKKSLSPIHIGEATVLTGPATAYKQLVDGAVAYYDKVNATGGIDGHKIVVTEKDTGYTAEGTVRVLKQLATNNLVVQGLASPAMPLVDASMAKAKAVFTPFADSSLLTATATSPLPSNFFGSNIYYSRLGAWVAKYMSSETNGGSIAVVNQTGPTAAPGSAGFMAWMEKNEPNEEVADLTFTSTTTDLSSIVAQLQSQKVQGVFFWGLAPQFVSFVNSEVNDGFKPLTVGTFGLASPTTVSALGNNANGLNFDVFVQPSTGCVGNYVNTVNKYFPGEVGSLTAQGWSSGAMVVAGLRADVKLYKTINEANLIKGLQHVSGTVGCVSNVKLSKTNHTLGTSATITTVTNGQFVFSQPFTPVPTSIPPIQ